MISKYMNKSRNKRNNRNRQNRRKTTRGGGRYWFRKETPQEMEKEWVEKTVTLAFDNIKETKVVIRFN